MAERLILYIKGETRRAGGNGGITVWMEVRNPTTNALEDPDTTYASTMKDSEGTTIWDAQALTKSSTGLYYKHYNFAADSPLGRWYIWGNTVDGTDKKSCC